MIASSINRAVRKLEQNFLVPYVWSLTIVVVDSKLWLILLFVNSSTLQDTEKFKSTSKKEEKMIPIAVYFFVLPA
jgi:hypothetical protein